MNKALLLFFFIFICLLQTRAQDSEIQKLQQQLKEHSQPDTFRVNRLNQLCLLSISAGLTDTLSNEALSISRKINYAVGEGYALVGQASAKFQKGDKAQSLALLRQAEAIAN